MLSRCIHLHLRRQKLLVKDKAGFEAGQGCTAFDATYAMPSCDAYSVLVGNHELFWMITRVPRKLACHSCPLIVLD